MEDDQDIQNLLVLILNLAGFNVQAEAAGNGGLLAAQKLTPSLITLDLGFPDQDGHDVAVQIRKLTQAPLVVITAFADSDAELASMPSGATAYLAKPFRAARLRELIDQLFSPQ
ncbi:response regulator transcription factor [Paenarthrobacter nitroguajacolicus]|uniref:response regulator transcription factor n=1 Tax=Paenarthrobacter nitroguajacolicus TaxID=211146 RepID=UPI00244DC03A|nr:response regulator [Paenarthrobacter nitroguajacolicus]